MAPFGFKASACRSMCWITPSLLITKVVRFAKPCAALRMPYSLLTFRWKSLSNGKVTPICFAKAWFVGTLSTLTPSTWVPVFRNLAISA